MNSLAFYLPLITLSSCCHIIIYGNFLYIRTGFSCHVFQILANNSKSVLKIKLYNYCQIIYLTIIGVEECRLLGCYAVWVL
jgi:hypothetical protein